MAETFTQERITASHANLIARLPQESQAQAFAQCWRKDWQDSEPPLFVQYVGQVEESMPWKETDVLEERTRFVLDHDSKQYTMAELCQTYGIARKTVYRWVKRYEEEGLGGLPDRRYGADNPPNDL